MPRFQTVELWSSIPVTLQYKSGQRVKKRPVQATNCGSRLISVCLGRRNDGTPIIHNLKLNSLSTEYFDKCFGSEHLNVGDMLRIPAGTSRTSYLPASKYAKMPETYFEVVS